MSSSCSDGQDNRDSRNIRIEDNQNKHATEDSLHTKLYGDNTYKGENHSRSKHESSDTINDLGEKNNKEDIHTDPLRKTITNPTRSDMMEAVQKKGMT